jgi:flagellar protein FliS
MNPSNPYQQYKKQKVLGAEREEILLLLYDEAIKQLQMAEKSILDHQIEGKAAGLSKGLNIIMELQSSLDPKVGGEIAANLNRLYEYMMVQLTLANYKGNIEAVREVLKLLKELRFAWGVAVETHRKERENSKAVPRQAHPA